MPNSSGVTLIWRRSIARIAPSWIGTSYFRPVRLSVMVRLSGIGALSLRRVFVPLRVRVGEGFGGRAVAAGQPSAEIRHLAALAAERPPRRVHRLLPAIDTQLLSSGQTTQSYRI